MRCIRELCSEGYRASPLVFIMIAGMSIALAISIVLAVITGGNTAYYAMFPDKNDIFMDYFNSIYYSLHRPYHDYQVIYPPFITTVYLFIGNMIHTDLEYSGFDIRDSYAGMFSYMVLTMTAVFLIHTIMRNRDGKCGIGAWNELFIFLIIFSYPSLFAIMRGNNIIFSMIFIMLFLAGYRSENRTIRYLSFVSLGVATGLKIYLALFGLLVVRNKEKRDIALCLIIGIVMFLLPFVFTDGNPILFLQNSLGYSTEPSFDWVLNINDWIGIFSMAGVSNGMISKLTLLFCMLSYLLTAAIVVFNMNIKNWQMVALISCNMVFGLGPSVAYTLVFLVLPIVAFLSEEHEATNLNIILTILFVLIMAVFPSFTQSSIWRESFVSLKGVCTMVIYWIVIFSLKRQGKLFEPKEWLSPTTDEDGGTE